jgi:c-di-GMP-binding flagellar brake protein YcgR
MSQDYEFAAMNLQVGARLQLFVERTGHRQQYFTTLIGYVPGEAILVMTPTENGLSAPFKQGEPLTVRAFSGVNVFSFRTSVDQNVSRPLACLHLAFPKAVSGTALRKAMRIKVSLPGKVTRSIVGEPPRTSDVSVTNVSVLGGLIEAQERLGEMGEEIDLSFSFIAQPGESEIQLGTRATIRNIKSVKTTTSQEQGPYAHGVEFADLDPTKQILLQQLIYETVIADRQRLV